MSEKEVADMSDDKPFVCGVCGSRMRTADAHSGPDFAAMWAETLNPPRRTSGQWLRDLLRKNRPTDQ